MQHVGRNRRQGTTLALAVLALALGACSMDRVSEMMPKSSDFRGFTEFEWNPYSKASSASVAPTFATPAPTAADLVNADGSCALVAQSEDGGGQPVSNAVALQMTECAVVHALGAPEKVDIGANERGDRTVKLLYTRGDRQGLYSFTGGRLKEVERIAEPAPAKPQKKPAAKPQPPRRSAT